MTFTTRPTLRGTFGMVSSTHWLASQSAMGVLERGGNAFDAAVAAGFVLHVVEPHLNGPAGEVPAILATATDPTPRVLCGQGPAPAAATVAHFRSLGLDLVPGAGPLAAVVPGAVDAWLLLLRDHGTRPLAEVLEPAIGYAAAGHPLVGAAGQTVARVRSLFSDHWPTSARLWLRDGRPPAPGEMVTNPAYADTLRRLLDAGRAAGTDREVQIEAARLAWREGFVAEAIDAFSRLPFRDSSGHAHAGLVTGDDLAGWSATWEEPVTLDWHGHTVAKTGFWGQGPVLLQTLSMLDALDDPAVYDPSSVEGIHAQAEALKLAFADREAWYGDTGVPGSALLSAGYARSRAALVGDRADASLRPGSPAGEPARLPSHLFAEVHRGAVPQDPSTGEPTVRSDGVTRGDTCHVDVVDRWGNIISATPSGGWLQSSPAVPELGFPLGSRLQMCWLEEGLASTLRPGRRPRTTLSPTLVLRDGEPVLACGTPGGDQQDQWQLLFLLRHLAGGQELQEAIDAPTWHTTSLPASFYPREVEPGALVLEDRFDADVLAGLRARGHTVRLSDPWSLGRMCAVTRDPHTGVLSAGANPRGAQGYATGR
ncbi:MULTISPECIES: gamma-glutamyltransferase family protein [unclassified Micromonospora]|uniref:gamma-glutamyltransferase family protein n=1 Tax=unclassified Micromonospora TaxID=2617518 RepID=UPI001C23CEBE|nr:MULTISPECIES: gamma-glutamyltransferase family protein [unclassified Micromonospora]MBU8860857.1 gamma-glutamyltransferase family protein [Micromonospora sp. WMMB482]MDM4780399.1 gamma-glutamyltransferase family protein [Micromonospora sp. b486]